MPELEWDTHNFCDWEQDIHSPIVLRHAGAAKPTMKKTEHTATPMNPTL